MSGADRTGAAAARGTILLVVHPVLRPTYYLPFQSSLPLPAGTPLLLLPHGVPAYYLSTYSGPAAALTAQFDEVLIGLGAGNWKRPSPGSNTHQDPTFIVVWLAVQNKQGEDKGMPVIWPATLCVSYHPNSPAVHARASLPYIPQLPTQLQASPPPPVPPVPQSLPLGIPATPSAEVPASATTTSPQVPLPSAERDRLTPSFQRRPTLARASTTERQEQEILASMKGGQEIGQPPPSISPVPTISKPELPPIQTYGLADLKTANPPTQVEAAEDAPASASSVHSGDSLFSFQDADAPADVPSPEGIVVDPTNSAEEGVVTTAPVDIPPPINTASFDPFQSFENGWVQPPSTFMDVNEDYDMEAYRATHALVNTAPPDNFPSVFALAPVTAVDGPVPAPGPPSAHLLVEPFTPRTSVDMQVILDSHGPPELVPPSPSRTLSSHSAPATPSVILADSDKSPANRKFSFATLAPSVFDPIPFAPSHREADGKYAIGKFALPTPPMDQDRVEPMVFISSRPTFPGSWESKYRAATDPKIGIIRKLIGVKPRKSPWDSYREPEEWQSSSPPAVEVDSDESDDEVWMEEDDSVAAPRPSTPPPSYLPLGPTLLHTHFHHAHLLPMCTPLRPPGVAVNNAPGNAPPISVPTPKSKSLEAAAQVLVNEVVENPIWAEAWRANASLSPTPPVLPARIWQADAQFISNFLGRPYQSRAAMTELQTLCGGGSGQGDARLTISDLEAPLITLAKGDAVMQVLPPSLRFWEKLGLSPRAGPKDVTAYVFFESSDEDRGAEVEDWLARVSAAYHAKGFGAHTLGVCKNGAKGTFPTRFDALRKALSMFRFNVSFMSPRGPHAVFYIVTPVSIISSSSTILRQILSAVRRFYKAHTDDDILVHFVPEYVVFGNLSHPAANLGRLDTFVGSVYDRILIPVNRTMSRKFFTHGAPVVRHFEAPAYALVPSSFVRTRNGALHSKVTFSLDPGAQTLDVTRRHMLLHVGYQVSFCGRWILAACIDAEGETHVLKAWLTPDEYVEAFVVQQVWNLVHGISKRAHIEWRIVISKLGLMHYSELDAWVEHLESVVTTSNDTPPVHVTLLAVDHEHSWTFLAPTDNISFDILHRTPIPAAAFPSSKSSRTRTVFSDASVTAYYLAPSSQSLLYPSITVDRSTKCGPFPLIPGSFEAPFIPDLEEDDSSYSVVSLSDSESLRVPAWVGVVSAPSSTDYTSLSTTRIFRLFTTHSPRSTYAARASSPGDAQQDLMGDIVRSFHDLAVLSRVRWRLPSDPALPFHLAALELMRAALSGGAVDP
ncbi:uncharacterized protein BXZ73DRAFT_91803 [Epithele typhae]|uniref:uncharacterized protein n=1 Tax=Epithele typhae TaxID=378194 RepID=UPI002008D146|nr:uncharacterized protein BXZ73DRAFT_91803 [Epithele typhae]KAH9921543.1 hypothetical protein BXZ73DRAFT_91803 [Epithele typhae]